MTPLQVQNKLSSYEKIVYESAFVYAYSVSSWIRNMLFTHNLWLTQSDVENSRYKVRVIWWWFHIDSSAWTGTSEDNPWSWYNRCVWSSNNVSSSSINSLHFNANELRVWFEWDVTRNIKLQIIQLY